MPIYKFIAKDKLANVVSETIEAKDEAGVIDALHKKDLVIISVTEQKGPSAKGFRAKKTKLDSLVIFSRQLATLIDSGIPLVQALNILSDQAEDKNLSNVVKKICKDIEEGSSFYDALARHPQIFSGLFINMVKAGEAGGMLNVVLERLANYLEKTAMLIRKVRSSLIYPIVVVSMAIVITTVLLVKVVPTFKAIFDSLGGTLPLPTRVLIMVSNLLRHYFVFLIIALGAAGFLLKRYINTPNGRRVFDARVLRLPVFGPLLRKVAVAKFSSTLAILVKSGVPILNSLEIVAKTSGNKVVEEAIDKARTSIRQGESIAKPLEQSRVFPPMVVRMISVGEQTGQLEKMLTKISDFYDQQVDAAVSGLTSMIEPMVIAFLGLVIGGIVVALFLPILKITELLGR